MSYQRGSKSTGESKKKKKGTELLNLDGESNLWYTVQLSPHNLYYL